MFTLAQWISHPLWDWPRCLWWRHQGIVPHNISFLGRLFNILLIELHLFCVFAIFSWYKHRSEVVSTSTLKSSKWHWFHVKGLKIWPFEQRCASFFAVFSLRMHKNGNLWAFGKNFAVFIGSASLIFVLVALFLQFEDFFSQFLLDKLSLPRVYLIYWPREIRRFTPLW